MEVEYLLTKAAARKPKVAVMTRRMERVERRSLAGPRRGETRWRCSSVRAMEMCEESEESQDWELNIMRPDHGQAGCQL